MGSKITDAEPVEDPAHPHPQGTRGHVVVALALAEASVKARSGLPIDDDVDIENGGWAGVLSLRLVTTGLVTAADAVEQQPPADVLARAQQLT